MRGNFISSLLIGDRNYWQSNSSVIRLSFSNVAPPQPAMGWITAIAFGDCGRWELLRARPKPEARSAPKTVCNQNETLREAAPSVALGLALSPGETALRHRNCFSRRQGLPTALGMPFPTTPSLWPRIVRSPPRLFLEQARPESGRGALGVRHVWRMRRGRKGTADQVPADIARFDPGTLEVED
jgi:hypothetical protein